MRHLPEQGLDQRTLAATVGADQRMHAAGADLKGNVVEDRRAAQRQADFRKVEGWSRNLWELACQRKRCVI
ncbi:hypothetical protein FQZ97_995270 [compost metagenome]